MLYKQFNNHKLQKNGWTAIKPQFNNTGFENSDNSLLLLFLLYFITQPLHQAIENKMKPSIADKAEFDPIDISVFLTVFCIHGLTPAEKNTQYK